MRHSELISVTGDGIRIAAPTLAPIGISDRSRCWGIWTARQRRRRTPGQGVQHPHLVLSPVHPDYWTSVFQLEIGLAEKVGALANATSLLRDEVNILLAEQALSGFDQSTLTLLCEFPDVTGFAQELLKNLALHLRMAEERMAGVDMRAYVTTGEDRYREYVFKQIGLAMLMKQISLFSHMRHEEHQWFLKSREDQKDEQQQRKSDAPPPSHREQPFFPSRLVETGPQPWYLRNQDLESAADDLMSIRDRAGVDRPGPKPTWYEHIDAREADKIAMRVEDAIKSLAGTRHTKGVERTSGKGDGIPTEEANEVLRIRSYKESGKVASTDRIVWMLRRFWRRAWHRPLHFRNLLSLAYQRIWSASPAMEFEFDESRHMLVPTSGTMEDVLARIEDRKIEGQDLYPHVRLPSPAIGTVHKGERFLRIRLYPEELPRRDLAAATVRFHFGPAGVQEEGQGRLSQGLIASLSRDLAEGGFTIVQISNSNEGIQSRFEKGVLRVTVQEPPEAKPRWREPPKLAEEVRLRIEESLREFEGPEKSSIHTLKAVVEVRIVGMTRVFVSMPQKAAHRERLIETAREAASKVGCELDYADDKNPQSITMDVVERVRRCTAVLQFIILREEERIALLNGVPVVPDFQWLWYEAGLTKMAGKPLIRFMDRNLPEDLRPVVRPKADTENITHHFDSQVLYTPALQQDLVRVLSDITTRVQTRPLT